MPLRAPLLALLLPLLSLLATGCASSGLRSDPAADPEIQELKARVVELQRKAAVSEVEIARLRQQVADLAARQGGRISATPSPGAPARPSGAAGRRASPGTSRSTVDTAVPETGPARREVVPTVEEADLDVEDAAPPRPAPRAAAPPAAATGSTRPGMTSGSTSRPSTSSGSRTLPPASTARPAPARPAPAVEDAEDIEDVEVTRPSSAPSPAPSAPSTPPSASGASELTSPGAQALYDRGYTLYHQGRYVDAEASFQRFLQAQSTSELADNAQYWIGECRYSRGDMRGALAAFRETVERYPQGNKVSDALLKAGQSLESLGDVEGARVTYREVARRFPGTAAAAAAEERRSRLP